jgi:hypothetical protein
MSFRFTSFGRGKSFSSRCTFCVLARNRNISSHQLQ